MKKIVIAAAIILSLTTLNGLVGTASAFYKTNTQNEEVIPASREIQIPDTEIEKKEDFEEIKLLDNDICTFIVKDINLDGIHGYTMKVYIENKTPDNLTFVFNKCSVNNYLMNPFWGKEIEAGKKETTEISWFNKYFEQAGIKDVEVIAFNLRAFKTNNPDENNILDEPLVLYPKGGNEETITIPERESMAEEVILIDNETCKFIITGYLPEDPLGYTMNAYIENTTDKRLMFSIENASVNGFMVDPFWAAEVPSGKRECCGIAWSHASLNEYDIYDITEIEFIVRVYDSENYEAGNIIYETFKVTP